MGRLYIQCREHITSYTCIIKPGKHKAVDFKIGCGICGFKIRFVYAKQMGKITEGDTVDQREILIKFVSYSQK